MKEVSFEAGHDGPAVELVAAGEAGLDEEVEEKSAEVDEEPEDVAELKSLAPWTAPCALAAPSLFSR
jgi:hypothetical protein